MIEGGHGGRDIISKLVSACVMSSNSPPLILREDSGDKKIRSQLHVNLVLPPAAGKSSGIFTGVPKDMIYRCYDLTLPGVIGTINKEGEFSPGTAIEGAGRVIHIDERQNMSYGVLKALLNLLEGGYYSRNIGFMLKSGVKMRRKYCEVRGVRNTGRFEVRSRFSCLLTGILHTRIDRNQRSDIYVNSMAFMQRFSTVAFLPGVDDFFNVIRGKPLFDVNLPKKRDSDVEPVYIDEWNEFVDLFREEMLEFPLVKTFDSMKYGFLTRSCLDMIRLFAVNKKHAKSGHLPCKWLSNEGKNIAKFCIYSVVTKTLNSTEYKILNYVLNNEDFRQNKVAADLGISQPTVSKVLDKLCKFKLLGGSGYV